MEEKKTFTDVEVLKDAVETIGRLLIPVNQVEALGAPLNRVSNNLQALLEAIEQQQREKAAQAVAAEEPIIRFEEVPGDEEEG